MKKTWAPLIALCLIMAPMCSCAGPEEKKLKFYNKGKSLYENADYAMAKIEFKNAIQIDPNYADAHYLLGMTELKDSNYKETLGRLSKAVELNPQLWAAQLELGRLFLAAKLYDKSLEKAQLILAGQKDHTGAALLEVAVKIAQKKTDEATALLKKLEERKCTEPEFFILYAAIISNNGKPADAEGIIKKGIAVNPKSVQLLTALARLYASSNRHEELVSLLKTLVEIEPKEENHRFNLGDVYLKLGKTNEAESVIMSILNDNKDIKDKEEKQEVLYIRIARYYLSRNRVEDAKKILLQGKGKIEKSYDIHLALAEIFSAENKKDKALDLLNESLSFDKKKSAPGILKTKNAMASLNLSMNRIDQAKKYVDDVLSESPKNLDALYTSGLISLSNNRPADAVSSFRSVISQNPLREDAYGYLAKAHMMNNEQLLAMDAIKNGIKNLPDSVLLKKELINFNLMNKDFVSAESELKALITRNPKDVELKAGLGDMYRLWDKKAKSLEVYQGIKKTFPGNPLGYIKIAQHHIEAKQMDKAVKELESALKSMPDSFEILSNLTKLYSSRKEFAKAAAICQQQIGKKKNELIYRNLLGGVHEASGKNDEAIKAYQSALAINPKWPVPANSIARVYINSNRPDQAEKILVDAMERNPENSEAIQALGMIYENRKDYAKARTFYESILKKQPKNYSVTNNLAYLISETSSSPDDLKKAIGMSESILKEKPGDPAVSDTLSWLYYKSGNYEKALTTLNGVFQKNPDNPELNYHMGMILYKKGQMKEAKSHLEKAVKSKFAYRGSKEAKTVLDKIKG